MVWRQFWMHIDGGMFFSTAANSRFRKCMGLGHKMVWAMQAEGKLKDVAQKSIFHFFGVGVFLQDSSGRCGANFGCISMALCFS